MESGAVGLVLRLSRVVGIAPYPRGARVRVSKALVLYGFVLVTFLSFYLLLGTCIFLVQQKIPLSARDITRAISNSVTVALVLLGAYTAQGRMRRMARSLKQLKQIKKIPNTGAIPKDRITFWVIVIYICGSFIIHITESIMITFVTSECHTSLRCIFYIFFYFEANLVILLEMQLVAFAAEILLTLEMINKSLQRLECVESEYFSRMHTMNRYQKMPKVAWETANIEDTPVDVNNANINNVNTYICANEDISATNKTERTEYIIRQLGVHYRNICDIIRTWTSSDGLLMVLILINRMLHMVLLLLRLILGLTQNTDIFLPILIHTIINGIKHIVALVLFVEPFQRTHMQMERTSILVQTLKSYCGERRALSNELDLFLRMLMLQKISYSPLDMCTLGRPLVLKIFGGLISYLVVVLTYGPEAKRPSQIHVNSFFFSNVEKN